MFCCSAQLALNILVWLRFGFLHINLHPDILIYISFLRFHLIYLFKHLLFLVLFSVPI